MLLRTATGIVICPFVVILATSIAIPPYIPYSYYMSEPAVSQAESSKTHRAKKFLPFHNFTWIGADYAGGLRLIEPPLK
jgi:hypothetical protein